MREREIVCPSSPDGGPSSKIICLTCFINVRSCGVFFCHVGEQPLNRKGFRPPHGGSASASPWRKPRPRDNMFVYMSTRLTYCHTCAHLRVPGFARTRKHLSTMPANADKSGKGKGVKSGVCVCVLARARFVIYSPRTVYTKSAQALSLFHPLALFINNVCSLGARESNNQGQRISRAAKETVRVHKALSVHIVWGLGRGLATSPPLPLRCKIHLSMF